MLQPAVLMTTPTAPVLPERPLSVSGVREVETSLRVGDLVFTRIHGHLFSEIASLSGTWTNHVGVVTALSSAGAIVAESRVPFSCCTSFRRFVRRSSQGRVAVLRLPWRLSADETRRLQRAAGERMGYLYDTGFNLRSRRQFCSRFVREVLEESTGAVLGEVLTFSELLARKPDTDLRLWKVWYFGRIPWERTTVTPASLYASSSLQVVFDGQLWGG
jgi:hypothetical protein